MVGVVLRVLLDYEVILLCFRVYLFVEQGVAFQCGRYVSRRGGDEYEPAVLVCVHPELSLCIGNGCVETVRNDHSGNSLAFCVLYGSLDHVSLRSED